MTTKLMGRTRRVKSDQTPLIATPPTVGAGQSDQVKQAAIRLHKIRSVIARFTIMEKDLCRELLATTLVGKYVLTNKRGLPFMRLHHLHFNEAQVKAHVRKAYDSITLDRL